MMHVIDQLLRLFTATIRFPPNDTVREVLTTAQQRLLVLRHRWTLLDKPFVVAIVGLSNVGKSTLMNALLGDEFAPAGNYPCTACPVEFSFGTPLQLTVFPAEDYNRPHWVCSDATELLERLMAVADEKQRTFEGKVSRVQVTAPLPILENGLVLADTPGFNAVQLESRQGTHQQALEDYLRTKTSQVFWVVRATFGVDRAEKGFFERFLGEVCDDIIVTGSESLDEGQRLRWRRRVAAHLCGPMPRFHFVSGLHGAEAKRSGDAGKLERAGINNLEARLRELAVSGTRVGVLRQAVTDLAHQLGDWARSHWADATGYRGNFWNPPEWATLRSAAVSDTLCQEIVTALDVPEHSS